MKFLQSPRARRLLRIAAILYLMILLTLTHWPRLGPLPDVPGQDKTLHVFAYFLAAGLVLTAFLPSTRWATVSCFVLALLILGAADELTQPWFGRCCDFRDWLADFAGVLAGTFVIAKPILRR